MPKPSNDKKLSNNKKTKAYDAEDLRTVSENPEWTKADFAKAKPFPDVFPELASTIRRRGKQKTPTKTAISLRLDPDVLKAYKATGTGWQSRINNDLRKARNLD
jgi:uncharacterized protein (DUF4415 family)